MKSDKNGMALGMACPAQKKTLHSLHMTGNVAWLLHVGIWDQILHCLGMEKECDSASLSVSLYLPILLNDKRLPALTAAVAG